MGKNNLRKASVSLAKLAQPYEILRAIGPDTEGLILGPMMMVVIVPMMMVVIGLMMMVVICPCIKGD